MMERYTIVPMVCSVRLLKSSRFNSTFSELLLVAVSINCQILVKGTITFTIFCWTFWHDLSCWISFFFYFVQLALQIIVQRIWTRKYLRYRIICQNAVIKISIFYVCMKLFQRITLSFIWEAPFKMWTCTSCWKSFTRWKICLTIHCIWIITD